MGFQSRAHKAPSRLPLSSALLPTICHQVHPAFCYPSLAVTCLSDSSEPPHAPFALSGMPSPPLMGWCVPSYASKASSALNEPHVTPQPSHSHWAVAPAAFPRQHSEPPSPQDSTYRHPVALWLPTLFTRLREFQSNGGDKQYGKYLGPKRPSLNVC